VPGLTRSVGRAWGGYPLLDGRDRVIRADSKFGTGLILSEFKHKDGNDYVMVVNNSQTESTQIDLWVRGRQPRLYRVGWEAREDLITCGDGWNVERGEDFVVIHPWLAPGQMELYRVEDESVRSSKKRWISASGTVAEVSLWVAGVKAIDRNRSGDKKTPSSVGIARGTEPGSS